MSELTHETRGQTLWITFNRPQARNALTFAMYDRLAEICRAVAENPDERVRTSELVAQWRE